MVFNVRARGVFYAVYPTLALTSTFLNLLGENKTTIYLKIWPRPLNRWSSSLGTKITTNLLRIIFGPIESSGENSPKLLPWCAKWQSIVILEHCYYQVIIVHWTRRHRHLQITSLVTFVNLVISVPRCQSTEQNVLKVSFTDQGRQWTGLSVRLSAQRFFDRLSGVEQNIH